MLCALIEIFGAQSSVLPIDPGRRSVTLLVAIIETDRGIPRTGALAPALAVDRCVVTAVVGFYVSLRGVGVVAMATALLPGLIVVRVQIDTLSIVAVIIIVTPCSERPGRVAPECVTGTLSTQSERQCK